MIYHVNGTLEYCEVGFCVIDCNGVGYKLTVSDNTFSEICSHVGENAKLLTYLQVREDGVELFGFATESELEAFKLLITVSGVGPKAAIAILSVFSPDKLFITIMNEDTKAIAKANGIGAKTAARIVLELKDKVSKSYTESVSIPKTSTTNRNSEPIGTSKLSDAQSALLVLGYTKAEVISALRGVDISNKETDDIIRLALKNLSR